MGFFKNASDIQERVNRSPVAIAIALLVFGCFTYAFHWKANPYRDGAESFVRRDAAIAQAAGEIRRINLKTIVQGECAAKCPIYYFSVVGTRAIVRVSVESWSGPEGRLQFRLRLVRN